MSYEAAVEVREAVLEVAKELSRIAGVLEDLRLVLSPPTGYGVARAELARRLREEESIERRVKRNTVGLEGEGGGEGL